MPPYPYRPSCAANTITAATSLFRLPKQCRGQLDRRAKHPFSGGATAGRRRVFPGIARAYVAQHPPRSPILLYYGDSFAYFIYAFAPAAPIPYLGYVARIECARRAAYHAADMPPVEATRVCGLAAVSALCRPSPAPHPFRERRQLAPSCLLHIAREPVSHIIFYPSLALRSGSCADRASSLQV